MALCKVVIVANPYEAARLARWLERSPLPVARPVPTTDDDEDRDLAASDDPREDVRLVVLAGNLASSDARALARTLLGRARPPAIIWLTDASTEAGIESASGEAPAGTVKLRRPFEEVAFVAAVRQALVVEGVDVPPVRPPVAAPSSAETTPGLGPRGLKLGDDLIDAFVSAELKHAGSQTHPGDEPQTAEPREPTLIISPAVPPRPRASGPIIQPRPSLQRQAASPPVDTPLVPAKEVPFDTPQPGGFDQEHTPPPPAGGFASQLKRKMAAMEARLFGDSGDSPPTPIDDDLGDEMDLDKISAPGARALFDELREPTASMQVSFTGNTELLDASGTIVDTRRRPQESTVDLASTDVASLLGRLASEGFTGTATFKRGERVVVLHCDAGRPVFATSSSPHDRMGELLYREGKITRSHYEASKNIVAETGRRMGEILVELGYLKRRELLPAVRRHLEDLVYGLFAWELGEVRLSSGPATEEKIRLSAHPVALVFEGIRRKFMVGRLETRLGGTGAVILPPPRDVLAGVLGEAGATAAERASAEAFDGKRTIAEIGATVPGGVRVTLQVAHALVALGAARLRGSEPDKPAARPSGTGTGASADVRIDRERVLAKHALVLDGDYFMVLGLRRDATGFEIRRAWEAARRDFAVESFPLEIQASMAQVLGEILEVVDEAYRVLHGDALRERYLANLAD